MDSFTWNNTYFQVLYINLCETTTSSSTLAYSFTTTLRCEKFLQVKDALVLLCHVDFPMNHNY